MSMDIESAKMLETILAKDKRSLGEDEVAFLIGRRGYLNEEQYARYEDLFAVADGKKAPKASSDEEGADVETTDEEVDAKPKKGKK